MNERKGMKLNKNKIITYIQNHNEITRKDAEKLESWKAEKIIKKEKTATANIINKMLKNNLIKKIGEGPNTKYII